MVTAFRSSARQACVPGAGCCMTNSLGARVNRWFSAPSMTKRESALEGSSRVPPLKFPKRKSVVLRASTPSVARSMVVVDI